MVRPGETGWLAEVGNVRALREAIEQALAGESAGEQRVARARKVVEEKYPLKRQAQQYKALYGDILRTNRDT